MNGISPRTLNASDEAGPGTALAFEYTTRACAGQRVRPRAWLRCHAMRPPIPVHARHRDAKNTTLEYSCRPCFHIHEAVDGKPVVGIANEPDLTVCDMNVEIVVIRVTDIDRAKRFPGESGLTLSACDVNQHGAHERNGVLARKHTQ
jgi:hypothetical protein